MQKRRHTAAKAAVRTVGRKQLWLLKHRKIITAGIIVLAISAASVTGYLAAVSEKSPVAVNNLNIDNTVNDISGIQSLNESLTRDEQLCEAIEKINLQSELESEKAKAEDLNDALKSKEDEMNQLEDTILNALMANLNSQMLSRSSGTVSSYVEEARNLISLQNKLAAFKQTPEAAEIDLTEYEDTIKNKLDYLPTKKPSSGYMKGYGTRIHPVYFYRHFHPAVDMSSPTGTPIYAAGSGTVSIASYGRSQGNYIEINHGNGFTTVYMHCSKLNVKAGDRVTKGQLIGAVGSTGTATGPHLHFEIRLYGEPLNPVKMIMQ